MFQRNVAPAREVGQGQSRYQLKAHQKFRRSHDWQYAAGAIGNRKWRVVQGRLKMLARALATFDRTGDCVAIYPATNTILRRVRELEAKHAADTGEKLRTWSLRTLFVYLDLLNKGGIETKTGCAFNRKPRIRSLHPEALLSVPATRKHARRESCTRSRDESCTRAPANPAHKESIGELQTSAPTAGLGAEFGSSAVARAKSSSEASAAPKPDDDSSESLSLQDENEGDKQLRFWQIAKLKFHQETQDRYDDDVLTMILRDAMLRMEAKPISSPNYFVTVLRNGVKDSERMEEHYYFLSQLAKGNQFDASTPQTDDDVELTWLEEQRCQRRSRVLDKLIESRADENYPLRCSDVMRLAGFSRTTTKKLLIELQQQGDVYASDDGRWFWPVPGEDKDQYEMCGLHDDVREV